jgi:hypothetical protein
MQFLVVLILAAVLLHIGDASILVDSQAELGQQAQQTVQFSLLFAVFPLIPMTLVIIFSDFMIFVL